MAMLKENKTLKHGVRKLYCDGKRVRDLERENEGLRN